MIREGYEKVTLVIRIFSFQLRTRRIHQYTETIFQIPTVNNDLVVLPAKFVEELKSLPETTMSSSQAVADVSIAC